MTEYQVTLPDDAAHYVEEQIATGRFSSPSEVLADAVEQARLQAAKAQLANLVREGLTPGEEIEFTDEWWDQRTAELRAEHERRRTA